MTDRRPCSNSACSRDAVKRYKRLVDLCTACDLYARRHDGAMRPADVIRSSARRRLMVEVRRRRERELGRVGMVEQFAEPKGMSA